MAEANPTKEEVKKTVQIPEESSKVLRTTPAQSQESTANVASDAAGAAEEVKGG